MKIVIKHSTRSRQPRGLGLVELLVCASISAMMLTATAVAFKASVLTYRDNTDRNMLISNGRTAMRQLINEIRTADAHQPINDAIAPHALSDFHAGLVTENSGIIFQKTQPDVDDPNIIPGNNATYVTITWQYDPANMQLTRSRSINGVLTNAVMANFVQDFKVRMEPAKSAAQIAGGFTSFDILLRAVVTMKFQNLDANGNMQNTQGTGGLVTERMIDAVVPRKNFSGL